MMADRRVTLLAALLVAAFVFSAAADDMDEARRDIERERYESAEVKLVDIARNTNGQEKQEALYLLAGLKSSPAEAEIIYEELSRLDPASVWSDRAQLELAKIQYSVGNYQTALTILESSGACRTSDEACFFMGLSAALLKRYPEAEEVLSRVRRGRYSTWAALSLAEIDMQTDRVDAACDRYRSISRSSVSPIAMYRYGECLEKKGDSDDARRIFSDIVSSFGQTPEAVLAEQKLEILATPVAVQAPDQADNDANTPLESGYTIQFGSFQDRTNAIKLASELKAKLPGVRIDSDLVRNTEVHRVRYGYFRTRRDAQKKANDISNIVRDPISILTLP